MMEKKYSFLMSVYRNNKLEELKECIESMLCQTIPAEQIVIVVDGLIPDSLNEYLSDFAQDERFSFLYLEKNQGLGIALRQGMKLCRNEWIARMDSDDICLPDRIEKQFDYIQRNPDVSIVGMNIAEFVHSVTQIVGYRNTPEKHEDICLFLKNRCPFNHMTVIFKKSEVEKAGGYQDWHFNEDYYLWIRMFLAGCKFGNIGEIGVYARVGEDLYKRRGGLKYYKSERKLFKFMYKHKVICWINYQKAKSIRFVVQVLMTNGMRQWFFKKFARN